MEQKLIFFALFLSAFILEASSVRYNCYVRYYFQNTCYRFEFKDECQPYALKLCKPARLTRHDARCPRYFCDVSSISFCRVNQLVNVEITSFCRYRMHLSYFLYSFYLFITSSKVFMIEVLLVRLLCQAFVSDSTILFFPRTSLYCY